MIKCSKFRPSISIIFFIEVIITFPFPSSSLAQIPSFDIYDTLSKVRSNLKLLANLDDTLTVATIDVSDVENNFLGHCLNFTVQSYTDGKNAGYANPDVAEGVMDGIKRLSTNTKGGIILYPNK